MSSSDTHRCIGDHVQHLAESSSEYVGEHVLSTTLSVFGLGIAAGVAMVYLLSDGSIRRQDAGLADRLGRRVLDALPNVVPETLSRWHHG